MVGLVNKKWATTILIPEFISETQKFKEIQLKHISPHVKNLFTVV